MRILQVLRRTFLLSALAAWAHGAAAAVLQPADVGSFVVAPDVPAVLRWRTEAAQLDAQLAGPVEYVIGDYGGKAIASGKASVGEGGTVEVEVKLGQGFYDVEFPATKQRFGVLCLPAFGPRRDPFFAIDSAMSWLVRDDHVRRGLIRLLGHCGIGMSRERLHWGQINPIETSWNWESPRRYDGLRRMYMQDGVAVLEMFHDAAPWTGHLGKYPDDLVGTAGAWRQIIRRWRRGWGALEVWNEPDISFGANLPADQYAALVKTIAYVAAREKLNVPLVGGVVAHHNRPYLDAAACNGVLDCVDAFSFHTYGRAQQIEGLVGDYRAWLGAHDRQAMPLWLTECGRPWSRGPDRPPTDQDAQSALDITMKAVEARACGVARHFPFVYPYYEETTNNFGMMGRQATPLRSMAAYAFAVRVLSHKDYLGDLACDDEAVRRARVFGDGQETVVVLYTAQPKAEGQVRLSLAARHVAGIDGRPLPVTEQTTVPVPDGLSYVWLDRFELGDRLRTDTPAMRLWTIGRHDAPPRPPASPIVLRFQAPGELLAAKSEGYRVLSETPGRVPLTVRVFNLAEQPHEFALKLGFSPQAAALVGPRTRTLTVPAGALADVTWQADLAGAFAATGRLKVTVTATGGNAGRIAPLAIDLTGEATLPEVLSRHSRQRRLPMNQSARWQPSIVGHGRLKMHSTPERHWRMTAVFGEGDRWAYPVFSLPENIDLSRATALVIRARCQQAADVRVLLWEGDTGTGYLTQNSVIPADAKWHTVVVRFRDLSLSQANEPDANNRLNLEEVHRISIGFNSQAAENTLEVSDVYLVSGE